jgi:hypothetical protein
LYKGSSTSLDYSYGVLLKKLEDKKRFVGLVTKAVVSDKVSDNLRQQLQGWISDNQKVNHDALIALLDAEKAVPEVSLPNPS